MCSAKDCTRETVAKGLCRKHYDAQRWTTVGKHRTQLKAKAEGIEIARGRVWVDDSGFTAIVVCEECGVNFGPWIERPGNAHRFARQHRDSHRDRSADDE